MILRPNNKKIRAKVIKTHVDRAGYHGVVCFSCGNASQALIDVGLDVVDISPGGVLRANTWWTPEKIRRIWPSRFDATSGHLPLFLMARLAETYKSAMPQDTVDKMQEAKTVYVPTGSGETIICLDIAFPDIKWIAVYDLGVGTEFNINAPLNRVVRSRFETLWGKEGKAFYGKEIPTNSGTVA